MSLCRLYLGIFERITVLLHTYIYAKKKKIFKTPHNRKKITCYVCKLNKNKSDVPSAIIVCERVQYYNKLH